MTINLSDETLDTLRNALADAITRQSDMHHTLAGKLARARKSGNSQLSASLQDQMESCNSKILDYQHSLSIFEDTK